MKLAKVLVFCLLLNLSFMHHISATPRRSHIVHTKKQFTGAESEVDANHKILASVTGSLEEAQQATIYHYKSFGGFSAMLTPEQAKTLAENEYVVSVIESKMVDLHTTRSWDFLEKNHMFGYNSVIKGCKTDVIVGIIDTGIWERSPSFNDHGIPPLAKRFNGICDKGKRRQPFECNKVIVGARYYFKGIEARRGRPLDPSKEAISPLDTNGHGTCSASIIAGAPVQNVSFSGLAKGTARGGARARLAVYKACWGEGRCSEDDVVAAFDDAITEGVDIISMSLGGRIATRYDKDPIAMGALSAFHNGILVSASAGNENFYGSVVNNAPWMLTVAASTIDREFEANVELGNMEVLQGVSLSTTATEKKFPLIKGSDARARGVPQLKARSCKINSLDSSKIQNKIVICVKEDSLQDIDTSVREGGGAGIIIIEPFLQNDYSYGFQIPAAIINRREAEKLDRYLGQEAHPIAKINKARTSFGVQPAPVVADFSSRGPSKICPAILKPDVTAPGANILGAWSRAAPEKRLFNIISGTSASCPHVTAVAAVLKCLQPDWSPTTLMSAIMTTAIMFDNTGRWIRSNLNQTPATPYDLGSGHINEQAAINPGLVYNFNVTKHFHCNTKHEEGYGQLRNVTQMLDSQSNPSELNYPSIALPKMKGNFCIGRTVTYVEDDPTTYIAYIEVPDGVVKAIVIPSLLKFKYKGEKKSFKICFSSAKNDNGRLIFGSLTWCDGKITVRSPIALNVADTK